MAQGHTVRKEGPSSYFLCSDPGLSLSLFLPASSQLCRKHEHDTRAIWGRCTSHTSLKQSF